MATYKSPTNPFIRLNSTNNDNLSTTSTSTSNTINNNINTSNNNNNKTKKDAPGMAKPFVPPKHNNNTGENNTDQIIVSSSSVIPSYDEFTTKLDQTRKRDGELLDTDSLESRNKHSSSTACHETSNCEDKVEKDYSDDLNEVASSCCSMNQESDDISATIKNLTDQVVRQELEESLIGLDCKTKQNKIIEKRKNFTRKRSSQELRLANLQEEEEEEEQDNEDDLAEVNLAPMEQDTRQHQHLELIKKLRLQLRDLEKYAYERGQLDEVPASILAERQSVILNTLTKRLSLNIELDEIDKLELDELKRQVDKEIHDVIDPLITKEHLLNQLKTQLRDMERYIAHLHGTIGKIHDKKSCSCNMHGCFSLNSADSRLKNPHIEDNNSQYDSQTNSSPTGFFKSSSLMNNESLPKTSRLIRSLVTQLICTDLKLQESSRKEKAFEDALAKDHHDDEEGWSEREVKAVLKLPKYNDEAAWSLHIDKVMLATDSLVNLFTLEPQYQKSSDKRPVIDESLVESVVRRQLIPAIRELLSYGLIDPSSLPRSTSYASFLFNPYYLLSSLTCFPTSQKTHSNDKNDSTLDKIHIWKVIVDYYESRNEPQFKSSSVKTLSQSFNLGATNNGPLKITSKQAFLIAVEDIIETMAKCKPNGPESHFREFIYTALNQCKLTTWIRLVFKNKSVIRRYYHSFSFVCQPDKMGKFLTTLDSINKFEFKLKSDVESIEQYVNAF